jgi:transcriptional regulator with XRE-family HTH domain
MDQVKVGSFISQKRKSLGMTQKELAEMIDVTDKTISKWECGNGLPDIARLKPLCDALNVNVNELLSGENLSDEGYSLKAEEIIMALMKENDITKKGNKVQYMIGAFMAILALAFLAISTKETSITTVTFFLDIQSALLLCLFCGAGVLLSGKKSGKEIVNVLQKIVIPLSLFISLFEVVIVLSKLDNISNIGPNLAVCILTPFYGLGVYLIMVMIKSHQQ